MSCLLNLSLTNLAKVFRAFYNSRPEKRAPACVGELLKQVIKTFTYKESQVLRASVPKPGGWAEAIGAQCRRRTAAKHGRAKEVAAVPRAPDGPSMHPNNLHTSVFELKLHVCKSDVLWNHLLRNESSNSR